LRARYQSPSPSSPRADATRAFPRAAHAQISFWQGGAWGAVSPPPPPSLRARAACRVPPTETSGASLRLYSRLAMIRWNRTGAI
jgi:hypothetical protein